MVGILFGVFVAVALGLVIGIVRGLGFALWLALSGVVVWMASYFATAMLMPYMPRSAPPSPDDVRRFFGTLIICPTIVTLVYCVMCAILTRGLEKAS